MTPPGREKFELSTEKLQTNLEKLQYLVKFGVIAPSAHNVQPWVFKINENSIEISLNPERLLTESDKALRQVNISLGACAQSIFLAAKANGVNSNIEYFYDDNSRKAIRLVFGDLNFGKQNAEMLALILARQTNRMPYLQKPVPDGFVSKVKEVAQSYGLEATYIVDEKVKHEVTELTGLATADAFSDKGFKEEFVMHLHPSLKKFRTGFVGYNLGMPWLVSFLVPYVMKYTNQAQAQKKMAKEWLNNSPACLVLSASDDSAENCFKTGMAYLDIALLAEKEGLSMAPLAALVEIGNYYKKLQQIINISARPLMFLRVGFAKKKNIASPRLMLAEVLRF